MSHQSIGCHYQILIDGHPAKAFAGETVAAVLMTAGKRIFTQPSQYNLHRTLFCGMGICHQCLVTVNGVRDVRGCMTLIEAGMTVETKLPTGPTGDAYA